MRLPDLADHEVLRRPVPLHLSAAQGRGTPMLREDRELVTDLKRACNQAVPFALEFMAGTLSVADEEAYGLWLAEIAGRILIHAKMRAHLVVDGQAIVIDGQPMELALEPGPRPRPEPGR